MAENARIVYEDDGRIGDMASRREATIDDLYHVEGKAELVNGALVLMPLTSGLHGFACLRIAAALLRYEQSTNRGHAFGDSVGFIVNLPNRRSFGPDVAFCTQPLTDRFVEGAPLFAVEVRSREEYGPAAERAMAEKRADYFAAGTQVVWDVDTIRDQAVRVYRATELSTPTVYRRGKRAEAEPALPGWSMPVADLFPA
jgi:Uma2 family endonuclease